MPKERIDPPPSTTPPPINNNNNNNNNNTHKEWDEARCPVCMEHPHNAVLLLCSSRHNGCRPYMCDTSYRHSNCFDQFRKSTHAPVPQQQTQFETLEQQTQFETLEQQTQFVTPLLLCPLCRGHIDGWIVPESARTFMNAKLRSCSCETCQFTGTYSDLRKHARLDHPSLRPTQVDPERERRWTRLERQRGLGDLLSTLQSSFGEEEEEIGHTSPFPVDEGGLLTVFLLIQVFRPRTLSGTSRARTHLRVRRNSTPLWGETYDGHNTQSEDNDESDGSTAPSRRRTRRRTTPNNPE